MLVARNVLLVIHIIAAGFWIAQFPVEVVVQGWLRRNQGGAGELPVLLVAGRVLSMLGQIGGIGILITGLALVAVEGLGFLGIGGNTPLWLVIKQVNYLIALVIVFTMIQRQQTQILNEVDAKMKDGTTAAGLVQRFDRALMPSRIVNLLVLVNIILAVWKPM